MKSIYKYGWISVIFWYLVFAVTIFSQGSSDNWISLIVETPLAILIWILAAIFMYGFGSVTLKYDSGLNRLVIPTVYSFFLISLNLFAGGIFINIVSGL